MNEETRQILNKLILELSFQLKAAHDELDRIDANDSFSRVTVQAKISYITAEIEALNKFAKLMGE
jgi:hypothetical protein